MNDKTEKNTREEIDDINIKIESVTEDSCNAIDIEELKLIFK